MPILVTLLIATLFVGGCSQSEEERREYEEQAAEVHRASQEFMQHFSDAVYRSVTNGPSSIHLMFYNHWHRRHDVVMDSLCTFIYEETDFSSGPVRITARDQFDNETLQKQWCGPQSY